MSDYQPIDCGLHSKLELAIMHGSVIPVRIHRPDEEASQQHIKPLDLVTRNQEEYLLFEDEEGREVELRLDYLHFL